MAKSRAQLPHLHYPADMQQTRIINAHAFGGGGGPAFGNASRSFDGTNDLVVVSDAASLRGFSAITVGGWFKIDSTGAGSDFLVDKWNSNGWIFYYSHTDNSLRFYSQKVSFRDWYVAGLSIEDDWHLLCATFLYGPSNVPEIYIDGVSQTVVGEARTHADDASTGVNVGIGARASNSTNPFKGLAADVRIYSAALSSGQIEDWHAGTPVDETNLRLRVFSNSDDVLDYSGNGNHGTNYGSTYSTDGPLD